jgi:hypothetical protein
MVGSEGVAIVGRLFEANATIEELNISHNDIGNARCIALVNGLLSRNRCIRVLRLDGCGFDHEGGLQSEDLFKRMELLKSSTFHGMTLVKPGCIALADGLSQNQGLRKPGIRNCRIGMATKEQSESAAHSNPTTIWRGWIFTADRLLHRYRSREPAIVSPFLLSIILARVANHPAVHCVFTREHIPDLLADSDACSGATVQDGSGRKRKGDRLMQPSIHFFVCISMWRARGHGSQSTHLDFPLLCFGALFPYW